MNKLVIVNIAITLALLTATTLFSARLIGALTSLLPEGLVLVALSPQAGLASIFIASIAITAFIEIPIAILSVYLHIRPALYPREIKFMKENVLAAIILFLTGCAFGLFSYLRFGIPFFLWANKAIGLANFWSLSALMSQMLFASLSVGAAFLLPIALTNLIRYDVLKVQTLRKHRLLVALLVALAIVVIPWLPNNPIEQAAVFIPIYGLFEATIFLNRNHVKSPQTISGALA